MLVDDLLFEEAGITRVENGDLAHHLTHNNLEVLVVDFHTLQAVNVLYLVDDVFLHGCRAFDGQDIRRSDGTVGERRAGTHIIVFLHKDLFRQRYEIFLHFAGLRGNGNFTVTAFYLTEGDFTVDFGNNGGIRRVTGFKELGNTRQTTGDIAGLTHGTRNLHKYLAALDVLTFVNHQVGTHRQVVAANHFTALIENLGNRHTGTVFRLYDDFLTKTGLLVRFHFIGNTFDYIIETHLTGSFGNDNGIEGIPFADDIALFEHIAAIEIKFRTVRYIGIGQNDFGIGVDNTHFGQTANHNLHLLTRFVFTFHGTKLIDFENTVIT